MQIPDNQNILLAFVVITGLAVSLQAILLLIIFITLRKATGIIRDEAENLHSSLMPVLYDTRDTLASARETLVSTQEFLTNAQGFLTRVSPKVEATAGDLAEITHGLRTQVAQMQSSALEIMDGVQMQSNRLNHMITGLLDTVDRAGNFVTNVVSRPVQQVSGILRMVKAIVESLRGPSAQRR
jgi:hypothetical protein